MLPYRPIWPNVYSDPNGQGGTFYLKARPKAGQKLAKSLADSLVDRLADICADL